MSVFRRSYEYETAIYDDSSRKLFPGGLQPGIAGGWRHDQLGASRGVAASWPRDHGGRIAQWRGSADAHERGDGEHVRPAV